MTKTQALASVLLASHEYSEGRMDDNEYGTINDAAEDVLGTAALERLSTICTSERWSPEDMATCATDPADLAKILSRIGANGTRALCGEHGLPLFYAAGSVLCDHSEASCDLSWSDLQAEAGERIETRPGSDFLALDVWVVEVRETLTVKIDVTGLTAEQVNSLTGHLSAQCEAYDDEYMSTGVDMSYPDVAVLSVEVTSA